MKTIQKIFVIIIFIIALVVLKIVYVSPIFKNKSLLTIVQNSIINTINSTSRNNDSIESNLNSETEETSPSIEPTLTKELVKPTPTPTKIIIKPLITSTPIKNVTSDTAPWGVAQQISEHTWTIRVNDDSVMATPSEIFDALNNYRVTHGSQKLTLDSKLSEYAKSRAEYFYQKKTLDSHQGFNNYLTNEDGFNKLGFTWMGENASIGYRMNGVHLIEWIYASDEDHNKNQLNNAWNYVGIGVKGTANCLIFGTGKM